MTGSKLHLGRIIPLIALTFMGAAVAFSPARAEPTLNTSGLTPAQCYSKDSGCTQFCGNVTNTDLRYECFGICDRMLNRCLDTGDWSDSRVEADPGNGGGSSNPINPHVAMQATVLLMDTDGDGSLSLPEIEAVAGRAFKQADANGDGKITRIEIEGFFRAMKGQGRDEKPEK